MFGIGYQFGRLGARGGKLGFLLASPFTYLGDSLRAGNLADPYQSWKVLANDSRGGPVTNLAVGGTTSAQIATAAAAASSAQKAGYVGIDGGRNDVATSTVSDVVSNMASAIGNLTTDHYIIYGMPTASVEPRGSFNWAQVYWVNRQLMAAYGAKYCDWLRWAQTHGDGSTNDNADIASDLTPRSLRLMPDGSTDVLHFGRSANILIARTIEEPWAAARFATGIFVQPFCSFYLTGSAVTTAQGLGGAVCTIGMYGTADSVSIVSGDAAGDFAVDTSGNVTRNSALYILDAYRELTITAVKGGKSSTGAFRIFFGAAGTAPQDVTVSSAPLLLQPIAPTGLDSQKMSMVVAFSCAQGTDGTDMYLATAEPASGGSRVVLHRNTANRLALVMKNAAGTTVGSIQSASSGAGLITASSGTVYVFMSIDLSGAGGSSACKFYVNETSSLSFLVGTGGETMNLNVRRLLLAQTTSGALPFSGTIRTVWAAKDVAIDWSNAANRALFYDHTTGAPTDLGSSGAVTPSGGSLTTPYLYSIGAAGDWSYGVNLGTGGAFIGAVSSSGQFAGASLFVQPHQTFYLTGAAAAAAQLNSGAVATIAYQGTPTSMSITAGDSTNFAVSNAGALTRATATVLTNAYYDLTVRGANAITSSSGAVRVMIGASDTVPKKVTTDGKCYGTMSTAVSISDGAKISIVAALKPGADGTLMYFAGGEIGRLLIQYTTGNKIKITGKNVANGTVLSLQSTGSHVSADGLIWVFACADLSLGASSCHLYVNETDETNVLVASADVINFAHRHTLWAQDAAGDSPWTGDAEMLWIGAGYIDFSNSANRALFYNSGDKSAVDLGASGVISSITPHVYVEGWAADWAYGRNRGSGPQFISTIVSGASITTN